MTDAGTAPFGIGPVRVVVDEVARSGAADMALVQDRLAGLGVGPGAELNASRPAPTAAFSRRDRLRPGYDAAVAAAAAHGFTEVIRPVGGHLAVYGEGSLVLHLWAPHTQPREHIRQRFSLAAGGLADALGSLGVDARVGPVPGEYCSGEFSVNDGGTAKLVGTGQRIVRTGYLLSAVVMVHTVEPARRAMVDAYRELGLPFDPRTVGCVADRVPGITLGEVAAAVVEGLRDAVTLGSDAPASAASCPRGDRGGTG